MAMSGLEMRIWVTGDDGQEHEITGQVTDNFELTIEPVPGAREKYEHILKSIKPIEVTGHFRPVYRWFGDFLARVFSFSKN